MDNPFAQLKERWSHVPVLPDTSIPSDEFKCEACRGHGTVMGMPSGTIIPCPVCGPKRYEALRWRNSGIPENRRHCTFANFNKTTGTERALALAQSMLDEKNIVVIYGPPGCGKTHLAYAAVIDAITRGTPARIIRCLEWLNDLKGRLRAHSAEEGAVTVEWLIQGHQSIALLAIDELDVRTEWEIQTIDDLVTGREARGLPTLITTNWDREKMVAILPRVESRALMVLNKGADYRKRGIKKVKGGTEDEEKQF